MLELHSSKAPRGRKTLEKTEFIEALKAKGFITETPSRFVQLWEVKTEKGKEK